MVVFETARMRDEIEATPAEIDEYLKAHEADLKPSTRRPPTDGRAGRRRCASAMSSSRRRRPQRPGRQGARRGRAGKIKGGADFATVAKTASENERFKKRGGDLGWLPLRALRFGENVTKAVETLEKGQVSDVIEAPDGYHIVQLVDKREATSPLTPSSATWRRRQSATSAPRPRPRNRRTRPWPRPRRERRSTSCPGGRRYQGPRLQTFNDVQRNGNRVQGIGESKAVAAALFEEAKAGDVLPQVYEIGGDEYVLRLVARREPDMKKFRTTSQS